MVSIVDNKKVVQHVIIWDTLIEKSNDTNGKKWKNYNY